MGRVEDMLREVGLEPTGARETSTKQRILKQATTMLEKLSTYKSTDELNSKSSNQNWWAPKPSGGKRRITMRFGAMVVEGGSVVVDDDLATIRKTIELMKKSIEDSKDDDWVEEEERRKKLKEAKNSA